MTALAPMVPRLRGDLVARRDELLNELRPVEAALAALGASEQRVAVSYPRQRARRGANREAILRALAAGALMTLDGLAVETGLSKSTLSVTLSQMKTRGQVGNENGFWFLRIEEGGEDGA